MKISIFASLLAVASVGNLVTAADETQRKGLRGDSSNDRDLGILDWFKDQAENEEEPKLPVQLPNLGDGEGFPDIDFADLENLDMEKLMELLENLRGFLEQMQALLPLLPGLIQNLDEMEGLGALLNMIGIEPANCEVPCDECFSIGDDANCVEVQYKLNSERKRCVSEDVSNFLVNGVFERYECSTL